MADSEAGFSRRIRYWLEHAIVRAAWSFTEHLPEPLAIRCGATAGRISARLNASRRERARRNIELALGKELSPREIRRLLRRAATHIGLTTAETCWINRRIFSEDAAERFPVEGLHLLRDALAQGNGAICFSAHIGNWQYFGAMQALRLGGFSAPIRTPHNPYLVRFMTQLRNRVGIRELSTSEGVRPMLAALKRGDLLVVMIDQHARAGFAPTTFLGRAAATTAVVATLGLRRDVPVFFAYSLREGYSFRHRGYIEGPLELIRTGDYEADVTANTQRFNGMIEQVVRRCPEQWFGWGFPRWKLADKGERQQVG